MFEQITFVSTRGKDVRDVLEGGWRPSSVAAWTLDLSDIVCLESEQLSSGISDRWEGVCQ